MRFMRKSLLRFVALVRAGEVKEKNILVIFGSGHTAILNQLVRYNSNIELVSAEEVLN